MEQKIVFYQFIKESVHSYQFSFYSWLKFFQILIFWVVVCYFYVNKIKWPASFKLNNFFSQNLKCCIQLFIYLFNQKHSRVLLQSIQNMKIKSRNFIRYYRNIRGLKIYPGIFLLLQIPFYFYDCSHHAKNVFII